jgi:hypothetical protein
MPGSDPGDETGIIYLTYYATTEKSGAAKHSHVQGHDATVSRQLQLSHPHSIEGKSQHRAGPHRSDRVPARSDFGRQQLYRL